MIKPIIITLKNIQKLNYRKFKFIYQYSPWDIPKIINPEKTSDIFRKERYKN